MKIINPTVIKNTKGNILKYKLKHYFFKKKISDFYFSNIKKNTFKNWKIKKKETVLIVVEGNVIFEFDSKIKRTKKNINSRKKQILIIPKNTKFRFGSKKNNATLISFLNYKYDKN